MFAVYESYKAGLLRPKQWLNNISAGLIVGVVALPLAMAFAIASGVKPEQGIYTAIIAGVIVSLFGGSRVQIAGPTGAFIVILAGIVSQYGVSGLQIATMMAGVILLVLGAAKLGSIIRYIPDPVIVGFTSGIGVIIWVGQWQEFFGLPKIEGEHFHQKLVSIFHAFPQMDWATTGLALFSLALVIFGPKIPKLSKVPGPLLALVTVTVLQYFVGFEGIRTIGSAFGGIPQGLPEFSLPEVSFSQIILLIGPAFAIAMLGAIESLLSAVVADGMAGTKHNSNQELVGQGIANIVAPLFGGIAATGAIARTATNIRNGGTSPLSGVVHSLTLVIILIALAPLAVNIPLAVLSAILFVVAWNMSEVPHFIKLVKRAPKADVVILLLTFGLTVFADLVVAVNIGVIIATLHFVKRMASSVEVKASTHHELSAELLRHGQTQLPRELAVYALEGPFFFAAAETFERVMSSIQEQPEILIIRLKWVPFMDITGLQSIEEMIENFHKKNVQVLISGANTRVAMKLKKAGIVDLVGEDNFFSQFDDALSVSLQRLNISTAQ
ncbi:SulP family inorganic anion transporter [Vibrio anguillarum]|uniref:SulP family inorganic anion transporter n=1 Tax=Vibrio anguillarum TaxID=55601 RepID=UPI00097E2160|nr:SulP family inorganic anion transporter [Vibrio anguillarum]AQM21069.1 sodium-independent anion transporter [Vibrio anguillarum]AUB86088.1 sodium-independent anion transporter [Vibrio anguillarum]AUB89525.1 sodium-independent anion transporter [Vibrio anguillarum]AUB92966.1 sodium-independent anion transporter [Vibrio anguillarum]AUB96399.1 sodium-independent anion transporter [Vibrio anguillarum]